MSDESNEKYDPPYKVVTWKGACKLLFHFAVEGPGIENKPDETDPNMLTGSEIVFRSYADASDCAQGCNIAYEMGKRAALLETEKALQSLTKPMV